MKRLLITAGLAASALFAGTASAEAVWTSGQVQVIFAGYPGGAILFQTSGTVANPAKCSLTDSYIMTGDYDTENALQLLMEAKRTGGNISFSVRSDICGTVIQQDQYGSLPVVERIALN